MDFAAELNKDQLQAVEATEGRVRVIAGAGSGKTRVIAHRFAYLVNVLGVSPSNILCLTFTNKAAHEMKRRIAKIVNRESVNDFICTLHSFCVKFLKREIYRIGFPKNFVIIDETDAKELARQAMAEFNIDRKKTTAERFIRKVAKFKGADPRGYIRDWFVSTDHKPATDAIGRYLSLQIKQFALDYDDLEYLTLYILEEFPETQEYWSRMLNYIMVDEVQDCSSTDWKLIRALAAYHGNLCVVGDPDQAIYEWRGASPDLFVNFKSDTDIFLNRNYRSTPDILDIANSIISHNVNRIPKELFTLRLNEDRPVYYHHKTESDEVEWIAGKIEEEVLKGCDFSSFAILYRSSYLSRRIEQAMLKHHIPYSIWGGVRFFERREIKDIISYLRLIAYESDNLSFARVINTPSRKFGSVKMSRLSAIAEKEGVSLYTALRSHITEPPFNRKEIIDFVDLIEKGKVAAETMPVSELATMILNESGLGEMYRSDTEEERLENLTELIGSMQEFERTRLDADDALVFPYLAETALYVNSDHDQDTSRVRLMTIHQSKGLEFPTVFVCGLTEGIFPSHRTIRERLSEGEEEERRLMYVAVTRACNQLFLSESEGYLNDGGALKYPSRFITEIPEEMVKIEGNPSASLIEGSRSIAASVSENVAVVSEGDSKVGKKVSHAVFGEGKIVAFDSASGSYTIMFGDKERQLLEHVLKFLD